MDPKTETLNFTFDEATHTYRLRGEVLVSITQVLKAVGIARFGRPGTELENDFYLRRGKAVHRACELYSKGTINYATVTDEIFGYLTGWRKFLEETGFTPERIETPGFHEVYRFAGRLDMEGFLPSGGIIKVPRGGTRAIVELKSGVVEDWVALQTAAQDLLLPGVKRPRMRIGLQLKPDGGYKPTFFDDSTDHKVFISQVQNYYWRLSHGYLDQRAVA